MSASATPKNPHASLLMSLLNQAGKGTRPVDLEIRRATGAFLEARDCDPHLAPQNEIERAAALMLDWSQAKVSGDQVRIDAHARQLQAEAAANAFPVHQMVNAYRDSNFVDSMTNPNEHYRSYGNDLSFGVIPGKLADDAKVAIIGDWGTGLPDAAFLLDSLFAQHPDIAALLHLGDIYQRGSAAEVRDNFVSPIRAACKKHNLQIPVFAVPGDHEYKDSRGAAYYQMLDDVNNWDKSWQQQASYFCLRTQSGNWQFLGADTGWNPNYDDQPGLTPEEQAWHEDKLDPKKFKGKTVFLTHRQFLSAYDPLSASHGGTPHYNDKLVASLQSMLTGTTLRNIDLLLWGHEHRFVPFVDDLAKAGFPIPGYSGPVRAKLRLLGGSARETGGPKDPGYPFSAVVLPNPNNSRHPYVWASAAPTGAGGSALTYHSYSIVDFGASKISYFEVEAWEEGYKPANPVAGTAPILVDQL